MNQFLFYDVETSGLNPCFDQILQFAALRTDENLHITDEVEWLIPINSDTFPHPEAMATHQLSLDELANGCPEMEALAAIHQQLCTPNTTNLGYNTLGFDDEVLRFSFYRNLLPPYQHQTHFGCRRMDIYPLAACYYLFHRDCIEWPVIDGKVSLKLEHLNECNQLAHGAAHNALVDVAATVELAKRFRQKSDTWDFLCQLFNKATDQQRLSRYQSFHPGLCLAMMIDGRMGSNRQFIRPCWLIGQHEHYRNQSLWLPLDTPPQAIDANDPDESQQLSSRVIRKKWGEPPILLPIKDRFLAHCDEERQANFYQHLEWITTHHAALKQWGKQLCQHRYPNNPDVDADAALYQDRFPSQEEAALHQAFHQVTPEQKAALLTQIHHPIRRQHALRMLARHFPEQLTDGQLADFQTYLDAIKQGRVTDYRGRVKFHPAQ